MVSLDARTAAVALGRWCLGLIFLFSGIGKLPAVGQFVRLYLAPEFKNTWVPGAFVAGFGHVLPFLEIAMGALLLLGIFRNLVLFGTGLLLLALVFGQIVLGHAPIMFYNTGYLAFTAALLFLGEHDRWTIPPGKPKSRDRNVRR